MARTQSWARGAFKWSWDNTTKLLKLLRNTSGTTFTEQLRINSPEAGVNFLGITNGATSTGVTIAPVGSDTDINLTISPKGAGTVTVTGLSVADTSFAATNQTSITVNNDASTPKIKLSAPDSGTGNYTNTIAPAATLTANRTATMPDAAGVVVLDAATQTLTNKTLTTPTLTVPVIADFTSATHTHTDAASGGLISPSTTGTTSNTFDVDSDNTTGVLRLKTTTGGTAHTVTLQNATTTQAVTLTLPNVANDTLVGKTTTDTLTNKTLTNPTINAATLTGTVTISGTPTISGTWTNLGTVTTVDINGGSLDGVIIGAASAAAATVTTLSAEHATTPTITTASGKTNTGYVQVNGKTAGALKLLPIDDGTGTTTVTTQATAGATITLPSATCTLPGLGLANSFSAAQTIAVDNATNNATTDVLTLAHSTSGSAAAGIGTGVAFQVEDSDGVTEQATIEAIVTDVGTAGATVDNDILIQSQVAGAMKTVVRFVADEGGAGGAKLLQVGSDANAVSVDIHPATTARGTLRITAADSAGDTLTEITNASQAGARTYTIPDAGASASFVMSAGASTLAGARTFSAKPLVVIDDATNNGVTDVLQLTHTTSGSPAANMGAGIGVIIENATDATTEVSRIDFVTTNDQTKATLDTDVVVKTMLGGAEQPALTIDASAQEVVIGQNVTDADGMYGLRLYPVTTARGSLALQATAHASADRGTTITNATDMAGSITVTLPSTTCTLVGKDTTDTLTNKTIDANGTGNSVTNIDPTDTANATGTTVITGIPVVLQFTSTATGTLSGPAVPASRKFRVLSAQCVMTGAGAALDTVQLTNSNAGEAITEAIDLSAKSDKAVFDFATIDDAAYEIAATKTLNCVNASDARVNVTVIGVYLAA